MAEKKLFYKSKTFWVAIALFIVAILTDLEKLFSSEAMATIYLIVMVVLRHFTSHAVKWDFWN